MELVREEGVILLHLLKQVEELEHFLRAVRSNRWVFSWSAIVRYVFEEDLSGRSRKKGLEGREYRLPGVGHSIHERGQWGKGGLN